MGIKKKIIISLSFAIVGTTLFSSAIFATDLGNIKGNIMPFGSNISLSNDFIQDEIITNTETASESFENRFKPFLPQLPTCPPQELEGYKNFEVSEEVIKDLEVTPELLEKRNNSFTPQLPTCPPQELEGYENFEVSGEVIKDLEATSELLEKIKEDERRRLKRKDS